MNTIYDSHVHIFNARLLRDMVRLSKTTGTFGSASHKSAISVWWDYISEIVSAFFDSEKSNNKCVVKAMKRHFPDATICATVPLMMDTQYIFDDILRANQTISFDTFDIGHLEDQIKPLQQLSLKGNCYPFFAIDPRRPGIIGSVLRGNYVTRAPGGFYGIKLYPRLGYHPMAGGLPELYAYCANNNIPITTHCSAGGFPSWSSPSDKFCDPEGFRPALAANPKLRINFAHFGNACPAWGASIIDLMKTYPGVYSDLACYTGIGDLQGFKAAYWNNDIVKQRTMYGSDYDVFYFTKCKMTLDDYIQAFQDQFTAVELSNMMSVVPEQFLGF